MLPDVFPLTRQLVLHRVIRHIQQHVAMQDHAYCYCHASSQLPKRLARRLLDLQLLPFIVVTNPHIKRVYTAYYNAFETLRTWPMVSSLEENHAFCTLLRRLVDEHGECDSTVSSCISRLQQGSAATSASKVQGSTVSTAAWW